MHKMSQWKALPRPDLLTEKKVKKVAEAPSSSTESDMNGDILRGATEPGEEDIEDRSLPAQQIEQVADSRMIASHGIVYQPHGSKSMQVELSLELLDADDYYQARPGVGKVDLS